MEKKKVVIALGHRALGNTLPEQKEATKRTAKIIARLVKEGAEIVISHSNAPQVGMIHTAMNEFGKYHPDYTFAPMSVCSAMSQGYIGYDLQNAIRSELMKDGIYKPVCTVLTQVTVDPYDEAFAEPVKIIGRMMTQQEAEAEEEKGNYVTKVGDGYRRIVAAPKPQKVVEIDSIRALLQAGQIVIACGGGGIPVLEQKTELKGASAVIEKDYAAGLLAELLDADELMILTSVEKVAVGFHTETEELLGELTVEQAKAYMADQQFEANTMLPKVEASVEFVEKGEGRKAVITSIDKAVEGYLGKTGTIITK
ncbi:MAG: carbamate kinase [Oliverpabstia sp.]